MLEQGGAQDPRANALTNQMAQSTTQHTIKGSVSAAAGLADPHSWVRELYGVKEETGDKSKESKDKKESDHTPLDMKKFESKDGQSAPQHKQFFKKYQDEYEQFLSQKKKQEQDKKKQEEDEERKKKEEVQKKREEESQQSEVHGKPKAKLGQPRRKATTEQHPETKMGGAK